MLVGVFGGSLIAQDRAVQQAFEKLPRHEQSFRVDLVGLPIQQKYAQVDRTARHALAELTSTELLRVAFFRDFWIDSEFVRLVGLDGLAKHVRLRSGRLPRSCLPKACEVLQIGRKGKQVLHEGGINLVRVGVGELRDASIFGPAFEGLSQFRAQGSLLRSVVLIGPDASSFERIPPLQLLFRVRSWVAPLDPGAIRSWRIGTVLDRESHAQTRLGQADQAFALVGPDEALLHARERGRVSGQRMVLIGSGASVLLLGFAMVAAMGLRRGLAAERRRLLQRGATLPQVWLAHFTEVGAITIAGWLVGMTLGALAVAILAGLLGLPVGDTLRHGLVGRDAILALSVTWSLATVIVVGTTLSAGEQTGRRRLRLLDVAALGAALAVVVGFARGGLSADTLASGGDRTILLLLPGLVCFAGGVAAARLLGPLMLLGERVSRRAPPAVRLALLALARAPARTAVAGAFLVVSVGLALFAASYRATLERGAHDESAFAVPLDLTLSEGSELVLPLDAAPLERYRRLGPDVVGYPVLRRTAEIAGAGTSAQSVTVLGIPPPALARIRWRSDFSAAPLPLLKRELAPDGPAALRGVKIPADATAIRLRTRVRGSPLHVGLSLQDARGRIKVVSLGRASEGESTLTGRIPHATGEAAARQITGLELSLPENETHWFFHQAREGRLVKAPGGSLALEPLAATTSAGQVRLRVDWRDWIVPGGSASIRPDNSVRITYAFPEVQTFVFRPPQATDGHPLRVIASRGVARVAGPSGLLMLDFLNPQVPARIVGVANRFPTLHDDEEFVVVDETRLATALDADAPGTGAPLELWLAVPDKAVDEVAKRLSHPPFTALLVDSRRQRLRELNQDPLARAIGYILGVAAILGLGLSALGLCVTLVSELRDERGNYFDLETQGVAPQTLRLHLRVRAFVLFGFGVFGGTLLALVLSRLVVSLVLVSAETSSSEPPLVLEPGWTTIALALMALTLVAAAVAELSARHAFRGEIPEPGPGSLE